MHNIFSIRRSFLRTQWVIVVVGLLSVYCFDLFGSVTLLLLFSVWNTISFSYIFMKELKYSPDFHPIVILELINVMFIGISGISEFFNYLIDDELKVSDYIYTGSVGIGIILLTMSTLIIVTIFYYFEDKWKNAPNSTSTIIESIKGNNVRYARYGLIIYIVVWIFRIVNIVYPLANIANLLVQFIDRGHILSLLFIVFGMIKEPKNTGLRQMHWYIVIFEVLLALRTGMKESIIQCFIPYAVYLVLVYKEIGKERRKNLVLKILALSFFIIMFAFPYVQIFRTTAIEKGKEWSQISVTEVINEYLDYITSSGKYNDKSKEYKDSNVDALVSRSSSIDLNVTGIDHARRYGSEHVYLYYCGISLIPRVVWPDKPSIILGGQINNVFRGGSIQDSVEMGGNSMTFGLVGSCYFAMGIWASIIMSIVVGFVLTFLWRMTKRRLYRSIIAGWVLVFIMKTILKNFESLYDCGVNFVAMSLIYMMLMSLFVKDKQKLKIIR